MHQSRCLVPKRRPGSFLALLVGLSAAVAPLAPAAVAQEAEPAPEPIVVFTGQGWGHGVGMAQDGAYAMGLEGASTADILQHFYPGTSLGSAGGKVRVAVGGGNDVVVSFPGGGEVRSSRDGAQAPGFPVRVSSGGSVLLRYDGSYRAAPISGATIASMSAVLPAMVQAPDPDESEGGDAGLLGGTITLPPPEPAEEPPPPAPSPGMTLPAPPPPPSPPGGSDPGGPGESPAPPPGDPGEAVSGSALWAVPSGASTVAVPGGGARYRGALQAVAGEGGLRLVNELDVEDYLRGMGEVRDASWPRASLGAQAVAARTYALRAMATGGELCATQDCQVYLGQQAEYGAMDAAVAATRGQVVRFRGALAQTVYSASGGGVSATPGEGFGTSDDGLPYLRAVTYPTRDPQAWEQRLSLRQLGRRLGYPGTLSDLRVAGTGPSGRPLAVELLGDAGSREVSALSLRDTLGLRSTLWTMRVEVALPPPEEVGDGPLPVVDGGPSPTGGSTRISASVQRGRSLLGAAGLPTVAAETGLDLGLRAAATLVAALLVVGLYGTLGFQVGGGGTPRRTVTPEPPEPAEAEAAEGD